MRHESTRVVRSPLDNEISHDRLLVRDDLFKLGILAIAALPPASSMALDRFTLAHRKTRRSKIGNWSLIVVSDRDA